MSTRTGLRRLAALAGRGMGPGTAAAAGTRAGAVSPPLATGPAHSAFSPVALARLRAIAKNLARQGGDWMPSSATAFATTYAKASPFLAAGDCTPMPSDAPVYLVTMNGRFRGPAPAVPPNPGGRDGGDSCLLAVVDARSFRVAGTGLSRKAPAGSLGRPASLTWYSARAAS